MSDAPRLELGPAGEHVYAAGEARYPSATTIIGRVLREPWLERWRGKHGNAEADRRGAVARQWGTAIHARCATVARGAVALELGLSDEFQATTDAVRDWLEANVETIHAVELPVVNRTYGYGGTLDLYCTLKGAKLPAVVDFKTSAAVKLAAGMQTVAYTHADGINPKSSRLVLQLHKTEPGKLTVHKLTHGAGDFAAFLGALQIYRRLQEEGEI